LCRKERILRAVDLLPVVAYFFPWCELPVRNAGFSYGNRSIDGAVPQKLFSPTGEYIIGCPALTNTDSLLEGDSPNAS